MSQIRHIGLILILAVVGAAAGLVAGRWFVSSDSAPGRSATSIDGQSTIAPGMQVPELRLPDLDGQIRTLAEFAGKPLLINYWATWCAPCVEELPRLAAAHADRDAEGIAVLAIAMESNADQVRAFLTTHKLNLPVWLETPGRNDSSIQLGNTRSVLPFSVLIGADGRVLETHVGILREGDLNNWVQRAHP